VSTPWNLQRKERSSPYFVEDRKNEEELLRLAIQDRMLTAAMGGVLPEQTDPTIFRRVLDVGCGTGGWAIEAAQAYPTMSVFGIDISRHIIDYARAQAAAQQVVDRVEFAVMDALLILEFPIGFFDLVNLRLGISFMLTEDWPKMLSEMLRVTRPGGIVRVTDEEVIHTSSSSALTQLFNLLMCAFFRAGHLFEEETTGLSAHLAPLLAGHGGQEVQTKAYALEFRAGTPQGQAYYEDVAHAFHTLRPFLKKWGSLSPDCDALMQQALDDVQQSTFCATWNLLTAWGTRPDW
jgi:ubiquinone/menaquinone biosynthesis C-methylase UbiE